MRKNIAHLFFYLTVSFCASAQEKYDEPYRPQFHFSPPAHWMNDPNGLVYYKGNYHLFYQYYPDSTVWGPMHWGHAISKDLLHWQHLPVALYPDSLGLIFSGSAVVDAQNSSGLQKGNEKPIVATFTYHDMAGEKSGRNDFQTQGMAYSTDGGMHWEKYSGNPVIKNPGLRDFRDPKVSWHAASKHWILTMAAGDEVRFYRSPDLKKWEYTGSFGKKEGSHGGVWECPDLFELSTAEGTHKWVLLVSIGNGAVNGGSGTQYFIGEFDGKNFHNDNPADTIYWLDHGTDNYAGVTWDNTGKRRLFIGWMSNWQYAQVVPTNPWRSAMTLPRELSLQKINDHYRLITKPAAETIGLRKGDGAILASDQLYPADLAELELVFDLSKTGKQDIAVELVNDTNETIRIGYNTEKKQFYIDRRNLQGTAFHKSFAALHTAARILDKPLVKCRIFIDRSSVELFADEGTVVMTDLFFPKKPFQKIRVDAGNTLQYAKQYALKKTW